MLFVLNLLVSITANIISYYICKWLDGHKGNDSLED